MDKNTLSIVLFLLVITAVISVTIAITPIPPFGAFSTALNGSIFPAFSCTDSDGGYAPYQPGNI